MEQLAPLPAVRPRSFRAVAVLLCAVVFQASALQTEGPTVPEHDLREFQAFTAAVLPDRGSVVAVYEPASATSYGRYTVGFDAESGAWFVASWKSSIGRAPDRIAYKSDTKSGAIHEWADGAEIGPIGVADYFPFAYLAFFMERPDSIVSLTRTESNGWIVRYVQPGLEGMPENAVEFNGAGLPVRRWREDPNDRRDSAFNYAASFPSGFPIVQNWGLKPGSQVSGPRLVHVEFHERGNPALFERAAVHNTEIDNRAIVETRRQASIAGFTRNDDGTWNPPDQAKIRPYSGDDLRSYRWPLVLAGVTLVVLAGFEIVRRRRGA